MPAMHREAVRAWGQSRPWSLWAHLLASFWRRV